MLREQELPCQRWGEVESSDVVHCTTEVRDVNQTYLKCDRCVHVLTVHTCPVKSERPPSPPSPCSCPHEQGRGGFWSGRWAEIWGPQNRPQISIHFFFGMVCYHADTDFGTQVGAKRNWKKITFPIYICIKKVVKKRCFLGNKKTHEKLFLSSQTHQNFW